MPAGPLVSVIMPAHNAAPFIGQAIRSVQEQTYENIELIVVDDGSQDQTARVVREIAETDGRVTLLQQPNRGVAAARNAGIEASGGQYIAPLDADDVWHPQKIARQVLCMQKTGPSVGLVYTWWIGIDRAGDFLHFSHQWRVEGSVYEAMVSLNFTGNASTPLMRRTYVERAGGYDDQLKAQGGQGCEDWDLALRIARQSRVRVVPAYLVGYRRAAGSMSNESRTMRKSHELVMEKTRRLGPSMPDMIYRWSESHFYLHLAEVNYRSGRFRGIVYWLSRACSMGPGAVLSPWTVQLLAARFPEPVGRMVRFAWTKRCLKKGMKPLFGEGETRAYLPAFGRGVTRSDVPKPLQPA